MHTLTLNIQDNVFQEFLNFISSRKENIEITADKNLEHDAYFYERREELHQIRADIKSGKIEMLSEEQYEKEIEEFFLELEK